MFNRNRNRESGQALIEYALILALLMLGTVATIAATGSTLITKWDQVRQVLVVVSTEAKPAQPKMNIERITEDFLQRIQQFYSERGRWPRSWGDYAFTDIGLDPADWRQPVEGLYWGSNGDKVGMGLKPGDNVNRVYVKDLQGNTLRLYSGWKIWCVAGGGCYYHTVAPGNEVDISTLVIVDTSKTTAP